MFRRISISDITFLLIIRIASLIFVHLFVGSMGFEGRWCCGGKRLPWRELPTYSNCPHFGSLSSTSKMKIFSSDHSGLRPPDQFSVPFDDLKKLVDMKNHAVMKYLITSDQKYVMVLLNITHCDLNHVGVVFDVATNTLYGYYAVSSEAQFQAKYVKQLFLGPSGDTLALVVERQYCDKNLFTRKQFEVWSFCRNQEEVKRFDILHVHNSLEAAMRLHGPLFTPVPGHGVDLYCVAFFKDSYRLKNLYGTYFIALIDLAKNRYLRVAGPDETGLRGFDAALREAHLQHIEASPCGTYLAISAERYPGFQLQVSLLETTSLCLIHNIQVPLHMNRLDGLLSAACSANARVTFSACSSRLCIFSQPNQGSLTDLPQVKVYQLPVSVTLANFCKFYILRALNQKAVSQLPLPDSLKRFLQGGRHAPPEDDYIESWAPA